MAYIPPHKRYSKALSLTPDSLSLQLQRNLKLGSHEYVVYPSTHKSKMLQKYGLPGEVIYGERALHMWFAVGTIDIEGHFPSSLQFRHIPLKIFHQIDREEKALLLVNTNQNSEDVPLGNKMSPWVFIAERVHRDLFSCFHRLRKQMSVDNLDVRPVIVARFGKILFRRTPLVSLEAACNGSVTDNQLGNLKKAFNTNLATDMDCNIIRGAAAKMGLVSGEMEVTYTIKLSDATRIDSALSCKCRVRKEDNKLELFRVELNQLRHMVADVSYVDKNLDLRLMLCAKRTVTHLTDEEKNSIRGIVNSATLDPLVKGGLKWSSSGDRSPPGGRFRVIGIWYTNTTAYKNSSMRLKVRSVDRFEFMSSTGEASTEINLKLKGVVKKLEEEGEADLVLDMLKENLKLIWDNILCFDHSLT